MSKTRHHSGRRTHARDWRVRALCGDKGTLWVIVLRSHDPFWNMVTCKRCLRLQFKHERYLK